MQQLQQRLDGGSEPVRRQSEISLQEEMQQLQQRLDGGLRLLTEKMNAIDAKLESTFYAGTASVCSMATGGYEDGEDGNGRERFLSMRTGTQSESRLNYMRQSNLTKRMTSAGEALQRKIQEAEPNPTTAVHRFVHNPWFEYATFFMILLNSLFFAVELEYRAFYPDDTPPTAFFAFRLVFLAFYFAEWVLRVCAERGHFWLSDNWMWNMFDSVLLVCFIFEIIKGVTFLRFIRIVRVIRVLRNFTQLRMMIGSIWGAVKPLVWTLVLVLVMIYITAVALTQGTLDHMKDIPREVASPDELTLMEHYGHLYLSIYSLYKAFTGGADWGDLLEPLFVLNPFYVVIFLAYITFMLLAVINIIAAIFVEAAVQSGQLDAAYVIRQEQVHEDNFLQEMRQIFRKADTDGSSTVNLTELEKCFGDETVRLRLKCLGLDVSEAKELFRALGVSKQGEIVSDDFARRCLRLRGHARCVDTANLRLDNRKMEKRMAMLEGRLGGFTDMQHSQSTPALRYQDTQSSSLGTVDKRSQSAPAGGHGAACIGRSMSWRTAETSRGTPAGGSWSPPSSPMSHVQWQQRDTGRGISFRLDDDLASHSSKESSRSSGNAHGRAAAGSGGGARTPPRSEGTAASKTPARCMIGLGLLAGCGRRRGTFTGV